MSENIGFRFKSREETIDPFTHRAAKASGKIAVADARREQVRSEAISALTDKITPLDMSEGGKGIGRMNAIMLANAENGKPPMIFTKATEQARDPVDVAFGDTDFTGKNIVEINTGSAIGEDDLRAIQGAFPEGVTLIGNQGDTMIGAADYEGMLREGDAVVLMHSQEAQVASQEQHHPQAA